jgi:hypothetical protein
MSNFNENPFQDSSDEAVVAAAAPPPVRTAGLRSPTQLITAGSLRPPLRLLSLEGLEREPPTSWQIANLLEQNSIAVLYGLTKTYKSFLALSAGLSIANGLPFAGRAVQQGAVAYIAAEGSTTGYRKRWSAWNRQYGGSAQAPFRVLPSALNVSDPASVTEFIELLHEAEDSIGERFRLVIIDTIARCFGAGEENRATDVKLYLDGCTRIRDALAATVLNLAHPGKDVEKGIRGNSALPSNVDAMFYVSRPPATTGVVRLDVEKQKDSEEGDPLWFEMQRTELGNNETSLVAIATTAPEASVDGTGPGVNLTPSRLAVLEIYREAGADGLSPHDAIVKAAARGVLKTTFHNVRNFLLKAHLIEETGDRVYAV